MLLTGLKVLGNVRIRETNSGNELKDYVIDIFKGSGTITSDFGRLFFYLLPTGEIIGTDDVDNSITTGFFAKFYDVNGTEIASTNTGKVDAYETDDTFIYKAKGSISLTNIANDTYVSKVEYYYRGDGGTVPVDVNIITSEALSVSTLAEKDNNTNKRGIKLNTGNDAELSFEFVIEVAK